MFIACKDCHRQYEVDDLVPGSKFLCHCGKYVRVPSVTVKDAVINRCPSCGAALSADAKACQYCGSEISLAELSLGEACPNCLSRMFKGAKFCSTCGLPIKAEHLVPANDLGPCPRCGTKTLLERPVEGGSIEECSKCSGVWLSQTFFDRVVEERDEKAMGEFLGEHPAEERGEIRREKEIHYLACPQCGQMMNRKNFGRVSGVIIDWCRNHGYWFDPFELERIFEFIRAGGLDRARMRELEDAREELRRTRDQRDSLTSSGTVPDPFSLGFQPRGDSLDLEDLVGGAVNGIAGVLRRIFHH